MTNQQKAILQQALEALEGGSDSWHLIGPAIDAIKDELEQPDRAQAMRDAGYTRRPTLREMAEDEQPYAAQARRVEQETHGRMRIDPVTGDVSIGTPAEQPEQEPEAFMYVGIKDDGTTHGPHLIWEPTYMDAMSAEKGARAIPLYAHPPRRDIESIIQRPKENDRVICIEDESLGTVQWTDAAGGPYIKFDDGSYGQWTLKEFGELFRYHASRSQWRTLTKENLNEIYHMDQFGLFCDFDEFCDIAEAIETKLKEKNHE